HTRRAAALHTPGMVRVGSGGPRNGRWVGPPASQLIKETLEGVALLGIIALQDRRLLLLLRHALALEDPLVLPDLLGSPLDGHEGPVILSKALPHQSTSEVPLQLSGYTLASGSRSSMTSTAKELLFSTCTRRVCPAGTIDGM